MHEDELLTAQQALQDEADAVVAALGLDRALAALGTATRVGSSALGLMVVRDIDLTVACGRLDTTTRLAVLQLGVSLGMDDRVRQVSFRDDTGRWNIDPAYPDGFYLGARCRGEAGHDWNLDIWFVDEPERQPDLEHLRSLAPRVTPAARTAVLRIKHELVRRGTYRTNGMGSFAVYTAVLDGGVRTPEEFDAWHGRDA